jgi:hypothetical protein
MSGALEAIAKNRQLSPLNVVANDSSSGKSVRL